MKTFLTWARQNLALPLAMAAITACCAALYQTMEIDGRQYQVAANMYEAGSSRFQAVMAQDAGKGEISRWTYIGLMRDFWTDGKGLSVPGPGEDIPVEEARALLMARIQGKAQ